MGKTSVLRQAKSLIEDPANDIDVSPASYWEIAIKVRVGKYTLNAPYDLFMQRGIAGNSFLILPIELKHTAVLTTLPLHHRDPFDRLLIAQALQHGLTVATTDPNVAAYPVPLLPAV